MPSISVTQVLLSSWPWPSPVNVTSSAFGPIAFVVAVDQALSPAAADGRTPTGIGHSMVVDPTGNVLLELGDEPDFAVIDLDHSVALTCHFPTDTAILPAL